MRPGGSQLSLYSRRARRKISRTQDLSVGQRLSAVDVLSCTNRKHDNASPRRFVDNAMRTSQARAAFPLQASYQLLADVRFVVEAPDELACLS